MKYKVLRQSLKQTVFLGNPLAQLLEIRLDAFGEVRDLGH